MSSSVNSLDRFDPSLRDLLVEHRPVSSLRPSSRNPRTHSRRQIRQIADSIRTFGFTNPILIGRDGDVIAGHGRIEAAKLLGLETVPTIALDHLSEAQRRAYVLADNKLAENAGWDNDLLALELQYLSGLEIDFDVTITGFEVGEIDILIGGLSDDPSDELPVPDNSVPPVTQAGDLWLIGKHRLLCGDARVSSDFGRLMDGTRASMVFTDPPYNVRIEGNVSGLGTTKHGEFAMASGEMSEPEFIAFLRTVFGNLVEHSTNGAIHFVCMDWRHLHELLAAARGTYTELKNVCVWSKTNAGMGTLYRSQHELVFVLKSGNKPHVNNVELGRHGRSRSNVWQYAGVNTFRADRMAELAMHPTVKPVALVADAILDVSRRKGVVLDCFAGSGTTLVAAEKTGRCAYAMEIDPSYVDVTIERMKRQYGLNAIHAETGLSIATIKEQRVETTTSKPAARKSARGDR